MPVFRFRSKKAPGEAFYDPDADLRWLIPWAVQGVMNTVGALVPEDKGIKALYDLFVLFDTALVEKPGRVDDIIREYAEEFEKVEPSVQLAVLKTFFMEIMALYGLFMRREASNDPAYAANSREAVGAEGLLSQLPKDLADQVMKHLKVYQPNLHRTLNTPEGTFTVSLVDSEGNHVIPDLKKYVAQRFRLVGAAATWDNVAKAADSLSGLDKVVCRQLCHPYMDDKLKQELMEA